MKTESETFITNSITRPQAYTILIVDDNPTNLGVLSNYLKDYGFRILVARSGESTLKKAQFVQPDLILLDIMMPDLNGFEICRHLKANPATKNIPIIFMTALTQIEDKVKGFELGAVDYITKPLQHEEVVARVATHLRLQQTTDELRAANAALYKRAVQLETSSQVGQQVTLMLDLDELLTQVVRLIQSKFGYYFVGVWLLNEQQDSVLLQARAGAVETRLPQQGYQIPVNRDDSAVVWVCREGEYHLAEDVSQASKYLALDELPEAHSELVLPLRVGPQIMGGLDILSDELAAFRDEDRVVLQTLADQIAIAIRNAQSYTLEQRRRKLAESLEHTGRVLSSNLELSQVSGRILEELAGVVPYERGAVMLQRGNELQSIARRGYPADKQAFELHVAIHQGDVFERMTRTKRPVLVDDVTKDSGWQQLDWLPVHHSWLGVPLMSQDRVIGMISLTRRDVAAFSLDDATFVLAFAGQAAIALKNASLYDEISQLNEQLEQKVTQRTEELNKAYKILERLDKTKSDFIEVTSHELRTPLSVVKGYTQILKTLTTVHTDPQAHELLTGILQGVNRLHQIVNTMLDVVKIDAQVLEMYREPVVLAGVIEKVCSQFEEVLPERKMTLALIDLDNLPVIQADPDLLFKVFYNLIVNAIKYTPDEGQITVSGRTVAPADGKPAVEIIVSDTGIGIDPEHHEHIFEKFYQTSELALHSSGQTKFKGGGPGLGLAIVRGIVLAHGGQVWVDSPGYDEKTCPGSHFHLLLPG